MKITFFCLHKNRKNVGINRINRTAVWDILNKGATTFFLFSTTEASAISN